MTKPSSPATPGGPDASRLVEFIAVMHRLRQECPWDREQTHESLTKYLVEETYEVLDAIAAGDPSHLREELGDLLLQVYFHAELAAERGQFDIEDVAGGIIDKLVYRHPHVFAGLHVRDADEVNANWERLKAEEKQRSHPLDGVPRDLPALTLAQKAAKRIDLAADDSLAGRVLALAEEANAANLDLESLVRAAVLTQAKG